MSTKILVEARPTYGRILYFPKNEPAYALADIAGSKTLTPAAMKIARERLGFEVEIVHPVDPAMEGIQ